MRMMTKFLGIAAAVVALAVSAQAQTVVFVGAGSSALFLEAGEAAATPTSATPAGVGATCIWSQKSGKATTLTVTDSKTESGQAWIAWMPVSGSCTTTRGTSIYVYVQTDSVIGNRLYFNGGTLGFNTTSPSGAATDNLINAVNSGITEQATLPSGIWSAVAGKALTAAGTDIRPEDAEFATQRATTPCGQAIGSSQYLGLGYTAGTSTINSYYSTSTFNVVNFTLPTSGYTAIPVGATPIIFAVNTSNTTNGFGTLTFGGSSPANISRARLAGYLNGTYGYTGDISGSATGANATVLIREPLSGTYNTVEYTVPNTANYLGTAGQLATSQDVGLHNLTTPTSTRDENNCSGTTYNTNPMHLASEDNANAYRNRVIGTGQAVSEVLAVQDALGYAFWSASNWAGTIASPSAKYLKVDGYDPLYDSSASNYSTIANTIPTNATTGNNDLQYVKFTDLNNGHYPAWSALRVVTGAPGSTNYTYANLLAQALQGFSTPTLPDFVPFTSLNVWRQHFTPPGVTVTPNNGTGTALGLSCGTELGGDVGGVILTTASCTTGGRQ